MTPQISTTLLKTQSDARLAQMVAAGQERAFEVLVARYERPLRRYCERMLAGALAEDVVQQTFLTLWSQLRNGNEVRELRPWLHRVAHNAALNTIKRAGYQYEQLDETIGSGEGPDAVLERTSVMRDTIAAVQALPERQREALVRTAIDGEPRTAVALELGLSDGAVGQLLHRARCALRAATTAITPLPLVAWLAGRHATGAPHMLALSATKTSAAGSGGTTGGTAAGGTAAGGTAAGGTAAGGTAAGGTAAGGALGGLSTGATAGLTSIAMKGAALVSVGLVAAATPVVAKHAFSHSGTQAADSALSSTPTTSIRLASAPLGPVTSAAFSQPSGDPGQTGAGGRSASATASASADAAAADTATGSTDPSASDASAAGAGTDTTSSPDQSAATDTTGSSSDPTATTDPAATTDPTPSPDPTATTDPAPTTDPGTTTAPGTTTDATPTTDPAAPTDPSSVATTPSATDPTASGTTPTP